MTTEQQQPQLRFYVDERIGCIAVRDRSLDNEDERGLHPDTDGVVWYRPGVLIKIPDCPTCGQSRGTRWEITDALREEAEAVCRDWNEREERASGVVVDGGAGI